MGVLMSDRWLGVIRRDEGPMDSDGDTPVEGRGPLLGPWPGRAREEQDGTWTIAVDAAAWPMEPRDLVIEPSTGTEWYVTTCQLLRNTLDPVVDYVRITAMVREGTDSTPPQAVANQVGGS